MAMFENFPYTDMHNLNLDWIIKIAKDFLDQYTHIQQLISDGEESLQNLTTEGLQQLQDKADALETLLNEWYNTHSEDIANQLQDALTALANENQDILDDLNDWYDNHSASISNQLATAIASFNSAADQKTAQSIASIPDDYTTLSNKVTNDCFQYRGALASGSYTNAKTGSYAVDNTSVSGLPAGMTQEYGWLICIVPNQLFILVESNESKTIWLKEGSTNWIQIKPTYYGAMTAGSYTRARIGTYAVDYNIVSGLPSGMTQAYGWLNCIVPNQLYILVESDDNKTVWLKEGSSNWMKIHPLYYGSLGAGAYTRARFGVYTVDKNEVTGLPAGMIDRFGWLICLCKNSIYILIESGDKKQIWLKEGNTDWLLISPKYKLFGKKIAYIGDSIAESRTGETFDNNGGSYPVLISKIVHGTYSNDAQGGATIARGTGVYAISSHITDMPLDADVVCLEGGINDYWLDVPMGTFTQNTFPAADTFDATTFCGAFEKMLRIAIDRWPGIPIVFVIVHKITTTAWTNNAQGYSFADMRDNMIAILKKYSVPFVDMWAEGGLNAYIPSLNNAYLNGGANTHPDGCHPDKNGYEKYYVPRLIEMFEKLLS